jgi:hypothetical protein
MSQPALFYVDDFGSHRATPAGVDYLARQSLREYLEDVPEADLVNGCLHVPNPNGPDYVVHPDGSVTNGTPDELADLLMPVECPTPLAKILAM